MSRPLLLGFAEYHDQAQAVARAAGLPYANVDVHHFPDGESLVRLPTELPEKIIFCRSLDRPNDKLVELILAAAEARELGARHLTLVAPYLCYMRQDKSFHDGEAVSQRVIGGLLAQAFDAVVTVDPHLHRVHKLSEAVPTTSSLALCAARPIAEFLAGELDDPLLVGPDAESEQWVAAVAAYQGLDYVVGSKTRSGDREVTIDLKADFAGRHVVLLDDIASTGRTLEVSATVIRAQKPASMTALVTHALFMDCALERLLNAGLWRIWSTDSIPHESNVIPLAELLAAAL